MIDLENIDKFDKLYNFLHPYVKFTHKLYYKKIYVIGEENIPEKGKPAFFITNHQNGLMDPMALLCLFKDNRQPVFIARGDIFKKDFVAKILRFCKILPTFRQRDGSRDDVKSNNLTFSIASNALKRGATLVMYPEAQHQEGHFMNNFKKGFPRIAFAAEEYSNFNLHLQIVPTSLHYKNYFHFREELLITIGKPFSLQPYLELYKTEPNNAFLQFNEECYRRVKEMTLDIEDREHYEEIDLLRNHWHKPRLIAQQKNPNHLPNQLQEDIKIVQELAQLKENNAEKYKQLMQNCRSYLIGLKKMKLRDWVIGCNITIYQLLLQSLLMILLFPFFLFGFINNAVPFYFSAIFRRKISDRMLHSSFNYAASAIISFPIFYMIIFAISWALVSLWFAGVYTIATFLFLFVFYNYKRKWLKFWASWRYYILKKRKDKTIISLIDLETKLTF